jgi:hypothetical protein
MGCGVSDFVRAPGGRVAGISPGALGCRSGFPPIPAETGRKYLSRSPLTVLLRQQVQTISPVRHRSNECWIKAGGGASP